MSHYFGHLQNETQVLLIRSIPNWGDHMGRTLPRVLQVLQRRVEATVHVAYAISYPWYPAANA